MTSTTPSSVLLLVNVQNNFFEGSNPIPDARRVADKISQVLQIARASDPKPQIIWVRNNGSYGDPDQPNTPGWHLYLEARQAEHTVDKTRNNAFDRGLLDSLIPTDADLIVVGVQSEYDVKSSCDSALARGNEVILVRGAHGTFHTEEYRAARIQDDVESELDDAGVRVVDVKDLTFR